MKEEQRVYIKGNSKRGDEIIKLLEDLGGSNIVPYTGINDSAYYFINPEGMIDIDSPSHGGVFPYIKEFYKEIRLPRWKPKYNERYYRITWMGTVVADKWYGFRNDESCYKFGNCFKTYEKAKEASRKIKEMLNR